MSNIPEIKEYREKGNPIDDDAYVFEQYPGVLCFRELPEGAMDFEKAKCRGQDVVRLHLELISREDIDDTHQTLLRDRPAWRAQEEKWKAEQQRVLHTYGKLEYGTSISRDIAVPGDMPLYALHYVIQQTFGWQNSHLHHFELPKDVFKKITGDKVKNWMDLVGVLFCSPLMDEEDRFWADDYEKGSFKTWLRRKYTGPYMSLNHGEGIIQSKKDIEYIKKQCKKVVVRYSADKDGSEKMIDASIARGKENLSVSEREKGIGIVRKEIMSVYDLPVEYLFYIFEESPNLVLERLSIDEVLALRDRGLDDEIADVEELRDSFDSLMDEDLLEDIYDIQETGQDEPWLQPLVVSCTDTLYYRYDYGDNWYVKITGSLGCEDLVREGRITQDEIDDALITVFNKYKPVCLAADGLPVLDDVGGIDGYVHFLRGIHKGKEEAFWKEIAKEKQLSEEEYSEMLPDNWDYDDADTLEWAKGLGWSKRMPGLKNLL